jgi:hypothetical protein
MDFLKKAAGELQQENSQQGGEQNQASGEQKPAAGGLGGLLGGLQEKANSVAGGGAEGEKNEDYLDKCVYPCLPLPSP